MRFCSLFLIASLAAAAESAPLTVTVPDVSLMHERFKASIYGKLWADPALRDARNKFAEGRIEAENELGFDPWEAVLTLKKFHLSFDDLEMLPGLEPKPDFHAQVSLDQFFAEKIIALAIAKEAQPAEVDGADEAIALGDIAGALARFGPVLVASTSPTRSKPEDVPSTDADLVYDLNLKSFMEIAAKADPGKQEDLKSVLAFYDGKIPEFQHCEVTIVPEGLLEKSVQSKTLDMAIPVDRAVLNALPANTMIAASIGLDGKKLWEIAKSLLATAGKDSMPDKSPEQAIAEVDQNLGQLGISEGIESIVSGFTGTSVIAVTNAAPFPGVSLIFPRTNGIDQLIDTGLAHWPVGEAPVTPQDGETVMLPIPNMPVPVMIGRNRTHWIITSDNVFAGQWAKGTTSGWAISTAGALALSRAPKNAKVICSSDTPTILRVLIPYLGLAMSSADDVEPADKQKILKCVTRASELASTGYLVGGDVGDTYVSEARGVIGSSSAVIVSVIAAIAIPNLLISREVADEGAVMSTLRSGIFPAEIQFQAGGYEDQDGDNIGEYGLISELAGRREVGTLKPGDLAFLSGPLATSDVCNGYRFAAYLPDGPAGAVGEPDQDGAREAKPASATAQERRFVVYAWPVDRRGGKHIYAITEDGQLRSSPWNGTAPEWHALFNGGGWDAPKAWPVHKR